MYVEVAGAFLLGAVFLVAAASKLRSFAGFRHELRQFGLLPPGLLTPAAAATVAAEVAVAPLLAVPPTTRWGYAVALTLLITFTAAMALALRRGARPSCRCFGAAGTPIGRRHLARNAVLIAVALVGLSAGAVADPAWHPVGLLVAGAFGLLAAALVIRLDDLAALFAPSASSRPH